MNVKQITRVTTLCSLFAANMYAGAYRHGVCSENKDEALNTRILTDDTIRTKGYQDKAFVEASMKIDSTKK